jgi:hypothetical protein
MTKSNLTTLKKNVKDPGVQKAFKTGMTTAAGLAIIPKPVVGKAVKQAAIVGKKAADPTKQRAVDKSKKASTSIMIGGVKYVLDRGRYKNVANVGSVSALKGDRGVGRAYRHQGGW